MRTDKSETIRSFLAIELDQELVPKILDVQNEFKKTNANITKSIAQLYILITE